MSEKILSLALRPRTLSSLYGQDSTVKSIRVMMAKRVPSTWMLYGTSGCGKTTLANIMAVAFQCRHMTVWGDPCDECWSREGSYAIHKINASDKTGVEDMRRVVELSRYKPTTGLKRVIVLNEVHRISGNAMDMLLDPTEKPADHVVWILVTTEPDKILDTLRKRCVKYQLRSLGITASEDFLKQMAEKAGIVKPLGPLFEQCHLMQVAAPRDLLMALEKYASGTTATEAVAGADESGIDTLRICRAVCSGKWAELRECLKEATPEQSRLVRATVVGYLRAILLKEADPIKIERAAVSMGELSQFPYDDAAMLSWLWSALWKICKRYRI